MSADGRGLVGIVAAIADAPARLLVGAVRGGHPYRLSLSAVALGVTAAIGATYLVFGALGVDPTAATITVRVHLAQSGGLLPGQDVTMRGVPIGKVGSVEFEPDGVVAVATIDADVRVPDDGTVDVTSLSTAGEQYLDFRPARTTGPYLADGAEIARVRTSAPVPLWQMLGSLDNTLAQVDPGKLASVIDELGVGPEGPRKLKDIIDGGIFLVSTLDSVLPQTVGLIRDSKTVLSTVGAGAPALTRFSTDAARFMRGVEAKSGGFVEVLDAAPGTLAALDAVLADNSADVVGMLTSLSTVAQVTNSRVPAMREFFYPTQRDGSTLEALIKVMHDGGLWGLVSLYPRYTCEYDLPRKPPSLADYPEPYLYTYCADTDPSVLVRGAHNAPRPPGERIAGPPPPGEPADRTATPTPIGPYSLPLPLPLVGSGQSIPAPPR
ncbi:MlaD family protein [Nocardia bovistercoris]|uniref:MCE family protein n=1 Tax=Nocardia bovistercoris TaxID=2785916 RepID=A0A931IE11_9NOCA|nr:MlaD family protein [Nocardia bovistercoris]MBH0778038.1 MCE family protein [Nocardia bovistercoris]